MSAVGSLAPAASLYGAPFFIGLPTASERDAQQFAIEIRYFWQRRTLQRNGKTESFDDDQHRVTLSIGQGRPFAGITKSVLNQSTLFFYADNLKAPATEVAAGLCCANQAAEHSVGGSVMVDA